MKVNIKNHGLDRKAYPDEAAVYMRRNLEECDNVQKELGMDMSILKKVIVDFWDSYIHQERYSLTYLKLEYAYDFVDKKITEWVKCNSAD